MKYCIAFNCESNSRKAKPNELEERIAYFRFPKKRTLRNRWVDRIRRKNWKPAQSSRLCSRHFEDSCFVHNPAVLRSIGWLVQRPRLKPDAVPTIFDFSFTDPKSKAEEKDLKKDKPKLERSAVVKRRRMRVSCVDFANL